MSDTENRELAIQTLRELCDTATDDEIRLQAAQHLYFADRDGGEVDTVAETMLEWEERLEALEKRVGVPKKRRLFA